MSAIISHKYKFIYPHIPRTGGTSLTQLMTPHLGGKDITDGQLEKHQSLNLISIGFPKETMEYVKFAVVRHPFDRLASLHQGYSPKCSLSSIVDQLYYGKIDIKTYAFFWPVQRWICDAYGTNLIDRVFKFEDGFKDVVQFLNTLGMPIDIKDFPHVNKGLVNDGNRKYYADQRKMCSKETMLKIEELYAWDYKNLDYKP